ncbi:hypothetical protein MXL95_23875, partial [Escherichia coli]|nr:hypothetical protein [Escherichia coli]
LTIFEIKLNGANFFFFSKHVLSPESPGNRPHPHYRLISLALTPQTPVILVLVSLGQSSF